MSSPDLEACWIRGCLQSGDSEQCSQNKNPSEKEHTVSRTDGLVVIETNKFLLAGSRLSG